MKKTVIVTGASRGIGRAIALKLASDFNVVINYNKSEDKANEVLNEILKNGGDAATFKADVSDFNQAKALCDFAIKKFGTVDVVVNNAGIAEQKVFCDITEDDFENMMRTNVGSVFNMSKAVMSEFLRKKEGKIINISSVWGICGASCEVHYSTSKSAIIGFTKALAKELAPSNIFVNCIAPGVVDTDMCTFDDETKNMLKEEIPVGKIASPFEIANTVKFLASDEASYITGEVINVSGGFVI
ncbi:MAG: glucose 1-dehydrogenase [Ruminococcaceae bacterium]|nr:glucose 1-dehydrogenase [Oscillospiraceae bacterium]